ncbi:DUF6228 family protein [Streptomyces collinus]|uniref:DUF6228 family protein n=1 Tax=Streptomyces collinus TaxID=42684 RepID=UPI0036876587
MGEAEEDSNARLPHQGLRAMGKRRDLGADLGGDGLGVFLTSLAEDFRGWKGVRTWHSLGCDLTLSAEHRHGGHVQLMWGIHDRAPSEEWHFPTTTVHAAGEDMRNLAAEVHTLIAGRREVAERGRLTT